MGCSKYFPKQRLNLVFQEILSEQLESLTSEKQSMAAGHESKLEKLHSELQEARSGLAGSAEKLKKESQAHQEVRSKWASLGKEHSKLQEELKV